MYRAAALTLTAALALGFLSTASFAAPTNIANNVRVSTVNPMLNAGGHRGGGLATGPHRFGPDRAATGNGGIVSVKTQKALQDVSKDTQRVKTDRSNVKADNRLLSDDQARQRRDGNIKDPTLRQNVLKADAERIAADRKAIATDRGQLKADQKALRNAEKALEKSFPKTF